MESFCKKEIESSNKQDLLNCYQNVPSEIYVDCHKQIKKKIKALKRELKISSLEDSNIILQNIFETHCQGDVMFLCQTSKKKQKLVIKSPEKCLKKLQQHIRSLTYGCKYSLNNYMNIINNKDNKNNK